MIKLIKKIIKWFFGREVKASGGVLQPSEYDISYFDGKNSSLTHNAGYTKYERWHRKDGADSLGEFWKDKANKLKNTHALGNKKVLELACAKGFVVEDLREFGVDAYGMDVSSYAIGEATPEVAPYLTIGDVRTDLSQYGNKEFDFVFSIRLIECLSDAEIEPLITEIKRISKKQAHVITVGTHLNSQYYNYKTLQQWLDTYSWPKGTILTNYNNLDNYLIK